jgi:hypothetical protein
MLDRTTRYEPPPRRRRRRGAPPGYEHLTIKWHTLTAAEIAFVCAFSDAINEIREQELDLLRLSTVDRIQSMGAALRELRQCR